MNISINEKVVAYLTLLSGLSISAVAVYYSVAGLTTIFAAYSYYCDGSVFRG